MSWNTGSLTYFRMKFKLVQVIYSDSVYATYNSLTLWNKNPVQKRRRKTRSNDLAQKSGIYKFHK